MVFIGGPRQVGKTTMAKLIAKENYKRCEYLNWDLDQDKKKILNLSFSPDSEIIIFDEVHKYKNWKNHIKSFYDVYGDKYRIIVTESARLDLYRKGGDSMLGRYHYHRLHPISYAEAAGCAGEFNMDEFEENHQLKFHEPRKQVIQDLMDYGGFPKLFLKKNKRTSKRWQNERKNRLFQEDIRDIEPIREVSMFRLLMNTLPSKVGSVFSLNSLREDLNVAHKTLAKWVDILDNFFYCFRIYPFNASEIKSLKKEPKLFLWDFSELSDESARYENLVASHLLKFVHHLCDAYGVNADLKYLRDIDKREVDFVVIIENRPAIAVEVKLSKQKVSSSLKYFRRKLDIPHAFQVILEDGVDFLSRKEDVRVLSADKFLSGLV